MDYSFRITLGRTDDGYELLRVERLPMRVAPSSELGREPGAGRVVEMEDGQGVVVYRRFLEGNVPTVETPTGDPARPLQRVIDRRPEQRVYALAPDDARARRLNIVERGGRDDSDQERPPEPRVLLSIELDEARDSQTKDDS